MNTVSDRTKQWTTFEQICFEWKHEIRTTLTQKLITVSFFCFLNVFVTAILEVWQRCFLLVRGKSVETLQFFCPVYIKFVHIWTFCKQASIGSIYTFCCAPSFRNRLFWGFCCYCCCWLFVCLFKRQPKVTKDQNRRCKQTNISNNNSDNNSNN